MLVDDDDVSTGTHRYKEIEYVDRGTSLVDRGLIVVGGYDVEMIGMYVPISLRSIYRCMQVEGM